MIIADENINSKIIKSIREIGIEVFSIIENCPGISDKEVIDLSKNPPRIILPEDKDFGEWVFAHHEQNLSIIFLRYNFKELSEIIIALRIVLLERIEEIKGCFITITPNKIRIRKI